LNKTAQRNPNSNPRSQPQYYQQPQQQYQQQQQQTFGQPVQPSSPAFDGNGFAGFNMGYFILFGV
jgi:hypothetical protein